MNTQAATSTATTQPTAVQTFMNSAVSYGLKTLGAIAVIILLLMISKIIAGAVRRNIVRNAAENDKKSAEKIGKLIGNIVFYVLMIFAFFIGFEIMGFNVGLIIGGVSFGVGLAFKEILGNMVAGIMMMYTKEFKMGDIVEINADQVYFGRIEEISIRYTTIRTLDLRQVILPNTTLITVPIKTFSSEAMIKLNAVYDVHFNTDLTKAVKLITDVVNSFDFVKDKETTKTFVSNFSVGPYVEIKTIFSFDPKCGIINEVAIGAINEKMSDEFTANNIVCPLNIIGISFDNAEQKALIKKKLEPVT